MAACDPKQDEPSNVTLELNPVTLQLKVGDIATIDTKGTATNIEWTSSNEEVASVYYGVVTAKAIGKAEITATSGKVSATANVFVTGTDGSSLRISPPVVTLRPGDTLNFSYGNTYDLDVTWSSSEPSIATIDQKGHLTAVAPGNAIITLATNIESVTARVAVEHTWGDYKLVWSDEFDGSALDETVWSYNTGGSGWGNNEKQYYTSRPENIRVKNGMLEIEALKEKYENNEYTSARIMSKGKKTFTYGKMEARIKFPGGKGTWPAFWMMPVNFRSWPADGEIDIMEEVGYHPDYVSSSLHANAHVHSNGTQVTHEMYCPGAEGEFHKYAIEWTHDKITTFVDGKVQLTYNNRGLGRDDWPYDDPFYVILNLAWGGAWGGLQGVDESALPVTMEVDYVRVFQK